MKTSRPMFTRLHPEGPVQVLSLTFHSQTSLPLNLQTKGSHKSAPSTGLLTSVLTDCGRA